MQSIDFTSLQSIMALEDFAKLSKLNDFTLITELFSFAENNTNIYDFLVKYFERNPEKINKITNNKMQTLLMMASKYEIGIVKIMCELGGNVNYHDCDWWFALQYATLNDNMCNVKVLLEYDAYGRTRTGNPYNSSEIAKESTMKENIKLLNVPA